MPRMGIFSRKKEEAVPVVAGTRVVYLYESDPLNTARVTRMLAVTKPDPNQYLPSAEAEMYGEALIALKFVKEKDPKVLAFGPVLLQMPNLGPVPIGADATVTDKNLIVYWRPSPTAQLHTLVAPHDSISMGEFLLPARLTLVNPDAIMSDGRVETTFDKGVFLLHGMVMNSTTTAANVAQLSLSVIGTMYELLRRKGDDRTKGIDW